MTDPGGDDPQPSDETESQLDAALGTFKPRRGSADSHPVSESGRSGLKWSPVTDTGSGTASEPRAQSSFQFDLGSALARLGGVAEPPSSADEVAIDAEPGEPLPVRSRHAEQAPDVPEQAPDVPEQAPDVPEQAPDAPEQAPDAPASEHSVAAPDPEESAPDPLPTRGRAESIDPEQPPVVDRLPTRTPRGDAAQNPAASPTAPAPDAELQPTEQSTEPQRSGARAQPSRSVFDGGNPTPTLPTGDTLNLPSLDTADRSSTTAFVGDGSLIPTLPAAVPAAPPPVIAPIESAPSTPDLNALRAAQLRANRNDRRGKLFGRSLLALLVVGVLVAGSLLFGRSYLFPTEWDPTLTPLVDEVQSARQAEFDHTVSLVERPASEYAPLVTAHVLGIDWNTRLPEWRALGLAVGDGAVADVQVRIATLYPAFFDPETDTIVVSAERSTEARQPALRLALESALAMQLGGEDAEPTPPLGLTGLESVQATARRAFDASAAGLVVGAPEAIADLAGVPVPVAYQLRAIDSIGAALVDEVTSPRPTDPLPPVVARLDDGATTTPGGLRQPGDQQVLEPVALGSDDWALIWGARLSPAVASQMVAEIRSDSYSVVSRAGVTCFVAVFQTGSDTAGAALLANLTSWTASAPVDAQATTAQLGPDRVQFEACDPGADAASVPSVGAVDLVIGRQLDRLTN